MKSAHQQRIEEFMRRAEQTIPERPTMPDAAIRLSRAAMLFEETMETLDALGCYVFRNDKGDFEVRLDALNPPSLAKAIDGCCDVSVVAIGTLSAMGCPDLPFIEEVDAANLRKFSGDAHKNEHGKWVKPTGFKGPDIEGVIERVRNGI